MGLINLRRKIKSIISTKQITRAMQMVAASKMRRAQDAVTATRSYALVSNEIMQRLAQQKSETVHPLLVKREVKRTVLIVIASDRSLAGGYNNNVVKQALEFLSKEPAGSVDVITIGKKAQEALARVNVEIVAHFTDFPSKPSTADLRPVAKLSIDAFLGAEYDRVAVVYTRFFSTLKQVAEIKQIVPVSFESAVERDQTEKVEEYLFEPSNSEVLNFIVPRLVEMQLLQAILESFASEHSSRMLAMKNATDNASDLIDDLKLTYNSVRQDNITRELAEISAGSS